MVDRMQDTADVLCGGNTSFSFFKDAAGFVFMRDYSASSSAQSETYAYRAVFEATGLRGSQDLQPTAIRVSSDVLKQVIVEFEGRNFESRNDFMPVCLDSDHPILESSGLQNFAGAAVQLLQEIFQTDHLDSCSSAEAYCDDWSYLAYNLWRTARVLHFHVCSQPATLRTSKHAQHAVRRLNHSKHGVAA